MREITEAEFEKEVIENQTPVLLKFTAEWCGPCRAMQPILEKFADEHPDIIVAKMDVDDAPNLCKEYAVRSIPKLVLFRNGEDVKEHVGSANMETLLKLIS
jgi:thioredoxin 1